MPSHMKKSTKKFEKNHLKDTLERRKSAAKIKQRQHLKDKRKAQNTSRRAENEEQQESTQDLKKQENAFADMNVDEFFAGGFDIPEAMQKGNKTGKRKRSVGEEEEEEESSGEEKVASGESNADEFGQHKDQLEALKEKDPEFYKYLKENDAELLDFGHHGDLAEVDGLSDHEVEDEEPAKKKAQQEDDTNDMDNTLDLATVKKWQLSMEEQYSIRAMRQVVLAFRAAAYVSDPDAQEQKYAISDANVYHQVLVTALRTVPKVLLHHLPVKDTASGKARVSQDSKKLKTLSPLIKSYMTSVEQLLTNLSDAQTLKLTLLSIEPMLPYILQFRKLLKTLIKIVIGIWADVSNTEATRITGFLLLRRLFVLGDAGIREAVLKSTYEGVIKSSRNTTVHTVAGINLMKNSASEIWGIDQNVSYTTGFTFIRQLAIHLRGSVTNTSKESYKTVYNWQYVHSLDFWSRVLSQHCDGFVEAKAGKQSELRPLIYPVVQITIGAMRLIPTAQYFPLRFQLIRSLLRLSCATGTYIPLASTLLEVLNSAEMRKRPKASTLKPLDFTTAIRAPKSYIRTHVYQEGVGEQVCELLSEFFVLWTKHISFPELSVPIIVMLKRWLKQVSSRSTGNKNGKVNQMIMLLVQKVEANCRWIEERRLHVSFTPRNRAEVESFLKDVNWESTPLGAFVKTQRRLRQERAAMIEEGIREDERRRAVEEGGDQMMKDGSEEDSEEVEEELDEDEVEVEGEEDEDDDSE